MQGRSHVRKRMWTGKSRIFSTFMEPRKAGWDMAWPAFQPGSWEVPQSRGQECDLVFRAELYENSWAKPQILPYFFSQVTRMSLRTTLFLTENKTSGRIFIVWSSGMLCTAGFTIESLIIYFYAWGKVQGATNCSNPSRPAVHLSFLILTVFMVLLDPVNHKETPWLGHTGLSRLPYHITSHSPGLPVFPAPFNIHSWHSGGI